MTAFPQIELQEIFHLQSSVQKYTCFFVCLFSFVLFLGGGGVGLFCFVLFFFRILSRLNVILHVFHYE